MMNFVYTLCSSTPGQIQYFGFKRALAKKSGDMIRDRVRILYLLFLWCCPAAVGLERGDIWRRLTLTYSNSGRHWRLLDRLPFRFQMC